MFPISQLDSGILNDHVIEQVKGEIKFEQACRHAKEVTTREIKHDSEAKLSIFFFISKTLLRCKTDERQMEVKQAHGQIAENKSADQVFTFSTSP